MRVATPSQTIQPAAGALDARIDELVDAWQQETGLPAVAVAVRRSGAAIADSVAGSTQVTSSGEAAGRPVTRDDQFWAGSITKTLVAGALLRLEERGVLSLDDRVSRWIPDFPDAARMSIRQLLRHEAGLPGMLWSDQVGAEARLLDPTSKPWSAPELLDAAARITRNWVRRADRPDDARRSPGAALAPGTPLPYSNTGYVVAGEILSRATGLPLTAAVQQEVLTPLGLTAADGALDVGDVPLPTSVHPYLGATDMRDFASGFLRNTMGGAGAFMTTAPALARIGESLLRYGSNELLTDTAHERQRDELRHSLEASPVPYGLGMIAGELQTERGWQPRIWHNGSVGGFTKSLLSHLPNDDLTVAILASKDDQPGQMETLTARIADVVASELG